MVGYQLEIKRDFVPHDEVGTVRLVGLGETAKGNVVESEDDIPRGNIELVASGLPPPGISEDFMKPVNDVSCDMGLGREKRGLMGNRRRIGGIRSGRWSL